MSKGPPLFFVLAILAAGCREDKKSEGAPPPPPPTVQAARAGACTTPGALSDSISAPFFPPAADGYCVDPQGQVRTYGEKGNLSMDEVCTTAFDGECEVYKRFGLKRVVALRYVDGAGRGSTVEVNLSQFEKPEGAYGMFTLRVVAGDPVEPSTPRVLAAGAAGAIGTGRAYVWRGQYLAELQYNNEQESPAEVAKSSAPILKAIGEQVGKKLPGPETLPAAAQLLPEERRIPNGIVYQPKDVLGITGVGPGAMGYYKDGDRRWRVLSIAKDDAEQAKDVFKAFKSKPGSLPIAATGDEAAHVVIQPTKGGPKVEMLVARKGPVVWAVMDEENVLAGADADKARVTKDEATAKMKPLLLREVRGANPPSGKAPPPASASSGGK